LIRTPCIAGSDSLPIYAIGEGIENAEALARDPDAMEAFIKEFSGRHDLQFVRWDYLTANK
jgi:hypothetical protein